jgi:hypothetical protein
MFQIVQKCSERFRNFVKVLNVSVSALKALKSLKEDFRKFLNVPEKSGYIKKF